MKPNKSIEFNHLRVFVGVAESETLTQAAEQLGVTQSAVSQAIKQLENQTGAELVDRRLRPLKLTSAGLALLAHARAMLASHQRMMTEVGLASDAGVQNLNVGMIDSFCEVAGLQFVQQVQPYASKLALRTGLTSPLTEALMSRDLDLLITSEPLHEHSELEHHPVLRDPFVMIVPEAVSQAGQATPEWLAKHVPFIHYNRRSRIGKFTDLIARRLNLVLNTQYELDSTLTLFRFVSAGQGWAIVPSICLAHYPDFRSQLRVMNLDGGLNARYISSYSRAGELGQLPASVATICRHISDDHVVPQLLAIAPWLRGQARAVDSLPAI